MAGVPTGGLQQVRRSLSGRGYGHTRYDTLDKVTLRGLREAAAMSARLVMRLAAVDEWPVARRGREEVLQLLDGPAYQEEVEFWQKLSEYYAQASGK